MQTSAEWSRLFGSHLVEQRIASGLLNLGERMTRIRVFKAPDFVMLAQAYGGHGIRCDKPGDLDDAIAEMISVKKPVIFDCRVAALANCFPMIPSGKAHNEMLLPDEASDEAVANAIDAKGRQLV